MLIASQAGLCLPGYKARLHVTPDHMHFVAWKYVFGMVRLKADCSAKEIGQNIEILHLFGITIISFNITNTKDSDQTTGMLVCNFDVCI